MKAKFKNINNKLILFEVEEISKEELRSLLDMCLANREKVRTVLLPDGEGVKLRIVMRNIDFNKTPGEAGVNIAFDLNILDLDEEE